VKLYSTMALMGEPARVSSTRSLMSLNRGFLCLGLSIVKPPLEIRFSLPDFLELRPQLRFRVSRGVLAVLKFCDTIPEQVVDQFHFRYPSLQRCVLGGKRLIRQWCFQMRTIDGRVGGRRGAVAECAKRG
jgi:hypothetical protein